METARINCRFPLCFNREHKSLQVLPALVAYSVWKYRLHTSYRFTNSSTDYMYLITTWCLELIWSCVICIFVYLQQVVVVHQFPRIISEIASHVVYPRFVESLINKSSFRFQASGRVSPELVDPITLHPPVPTAPPLWHVPCSPPVISYLA